MLSCQNILAKTSTGGLVRSDDEADEAFECTINFMSSLIGEEEEE